MTKLKNFVENFELDTSNDLKKLSLEEKLNNTSDVLNHIVELRTKVCELPEDVNIDNALEELEKSRGYTFRNKGKSKKLPYSIR
ncbi:hypothetical protein JTE90_005083 [Oedothorax gibbosus]|uniref:Uncharacterized protein n=1 Tax=Oedothorax gibbosus TaxID=931172 RepID=A0AAV6VCS5_9ARAC|nr:hypothetical protein JTE90_005083 [Oedothorax gibbosus]